MKLTCKECGDDLDFEELDLSKEELIVKPCKSCIEAADNAGYDAGQDSGYDSGYSDGYDSGYEKGEEDATPK